MSIEAKSAATRRGSPRQLGEAILQLLGFVRCSEVGVGDGEAPRDGRPRRRHELLAAEKGDVEGIDQDVQIVDVEFDEFVWE